MSRPRVVFGVPMYRGDAHLREALESLLAQDFDDLRVVITDDGGSQASALIVDEYVHLDDRVSYIRNPRRLGMIYNWRASFQQAHELHPDAEYFAWATDHDVWHPYWLSTLVGVLDADPGLVAAYPRTLGIDEQGRQILPGAKAGFDTVEIDDPSERLAAVVPRMAAGNMIYALFRSADLAECGIFPAVLLPDRLLLAKLAIRGRFREVPRTLWYRRYLPGVRPSLERQRGAFFPEGVPLYARLPWWAMHIGAMTLALVARREGGPAISRGRGLLLAARYGILTLRFQIERRRHRGLRRRRRLRKKLTKQARRHVVHGVRFARRGVKGVRRLVRRTAGNLLA